MITLKPNRFVQRGRIIASYDDGSLKDMPWIFQCPHELEDVITRLEVMIPAKVDVITISPFDWSIYNKNAWAKTAHNLCAHFPCRMNVKHVFGATNNLSNICVNCGEAVTWASLINDPTAIYGCRKPNPIILGAPAQNPQPCPGPKDSTCGDCPASPQCDIVPKCECGATKCGSNLHSSWCPIK
jgi:hypothetical protein